MRRDVTNCHKLHSEDRGVNEKEWIEVDGREALFKETQIKENGDSTYADYGEVIVSDICRLLDVPCAETELVIRDDKKGCLSYSFCEPNDALIDMGSVIQNIRYDFDSKYMHVASTKEVYGVDLILEAIESVCTSKKEFQEAKKAFIQDILLDSLIDHYDRNPSNLAILKRGTHYSLSPKYDNGTSLSISVPEFALKNIIDSPGTDREKHEKFREKIYSKIGYLGRKFVQYDELETYIFNYFYDESLDFTKKMISNLTPENIDKILNNEKYKNLSETHKQMIKMKLLSNKESMIDRQATIAKKKVIDNIIYNKAARNNFQSHVKKGTISLVLPEYDTTRNVPDLDPDYSFSLDEQIPEKIQNIVDINELSRYFRIPIHDSKQTNKAVGFSVFPEDNLVKKEFTKREKNLLKWVAIIETIHKANPDANSLEEITSRLGFVKEDIQLIKKLSTDKFKDETSCEEAYNLIYGEDGIGEENIDLYIAKKFIDASIMKTSIKDQRMDEIRVYANTLRETKELKHIIEDRSQSLRSRTFQGIGIKDPDEIISLQLKCARYARENPRISNKDLANYARELGKESQAKTQHEVSPGVYVDKEEFEELKKHLVTLEDGSTLAIFDAPTKLNKLVSRLAIEYTAYILDHPSGNGVTVSVSSRRGLHFPEKFDEYARSYVESHKKGDSKSYVYMDSTSKKNVSCFVVTTAEDPNIKIHDITAKEYKEKLISLFNNKEINKTNDKMQEGEDK